MKYFILICIAGFFPLLMQAQKKTTTDYMLIGKDVYIKHCQTCHQVDGNGAQNMIPPLIKSEYVLGDKPRIVKMVLNGMKGEIKVNGDLYDGEMPKQDTLSNHEIAAVLTYVRKSFGNNATAVTESEVKKIRAANQAPTEPKKKQ